MADWTPTGGPRGLASVRIGPSHSPQCRKIVTLHSNPEEWTEGHRENRGFALRFLRTLCFLYSPKPHNIHKYPGWLTRELALWLCVQRCLIVNFDQLKLPNSLSRCTSLSLPWSEWREETEVTENWLSVLSASSCSNSFFSSCSKHSQKRASKCQDCFLRGTSKANVKIGKLAPSAGSSYISTHGVCFAWHDRNWRTS